MQAIGDPEINLNEPEWLLCHVLINLNIWTRKSFNRVTINFTALLLFQFDEKVQSYLNVGKVITVLFKIQLNAYKWIGMESETRNENLWSVCDCFYYDFCPFLELELWHKKHNFAKRRQMKKKYRLYPSQWIANAFKGIVALGKDTL